MNKIIVLVLAFVSSLLYLKSIVALAESPMTLNISLDNMPYLNKEVEITITIFSYIDAPNTLLNITTTGFQIEKELWNLSIAKNKTQVIKTKIKAIQTGNLTLIVFAKNTIRNETWFGDIERLYIELTEDNVTISKHRKIPIKGKAKELKIKPKKQREIKPLSYDYIYVYGYLCYDEYCDIPAPYVTVYAWDEDELQFYGDTYLGSDITDADGYFEIGPILNVDIYSTYLDPYVEYITGSSAAVVETDEFSEIYSVFSETQYGVREDAYFANYIPLSPQNGAWIIYHSLILAFSYIAKEGYILPEITTKWPDTAFGGWLVKPDGAYYVPGGDMYLGADVYLSPDVVMHEYSHFVMYNAYGNWFPPAQCPDPHWITSKSNKVCAWTEGWAHFFPLAVRDKRNYRYYGHYNIDFEDLISEPEAYWEEGDDVEGNVVASLYDLYDNNNDNYDTITVGFTPIWNIFSAERRNTFYEFWQDWTIQKNIAKKILFQNYIDYDIAPSVTLISPQNNSVSQPIFQWFSYDLDDTLFENKIYIANETDIIIEESIGTKTNYSTTLPYGIYDWMVEVSDSLKSTFSDIWTFIHAKENISLTGYISNTNNRQIPKVPVELGEETAWLITKTDNKGYFRFTNLSYGYYDLYVNYYDTDGFVENYTTVEFTEEDAIELIDDTKLNLTLYKIDIHLYLNNSCFKNGDFVKANITITNNERFNLTDWYIFFGVDFENETYYENIYFNYTYINLSTKENYPFTYEIPKNNSYNELWVYAGVGAYYYAISSHGNLPGLVYKIDEKEIFIGGKTKFNISLLKGWNLVSIPLELENKILPAPLESIEGNYSYGFAYIDGKWYDYYAGDPPGKKYIDPTMGFWIYMLNNDVLEVEGCKLENFKLDLNKGWNLIGYPSLNETNVSSFFDDINITIVYTYNNSWLSYIPNRTFNSLQKLKPGYGYWVKIK